MYTGSAEKNLSTPSSAAFFSPAAFSLLYFHVKNKKLCLSHLEQTPRSASSASNQFAEFVPKNWSSNLGHNYLPIPKKKTVANVFIFQPCNLSQPWKPSFPRLSTLRITPSPLPWTLFALVVVGSFKSRRPGLTCYGGILRSSRRGGDVSPGYQPAGISLALKTRRVPRLFSPSLSMAKSAARACDSRLDPLIWPGRYRVAAAPEDPRELARAHDAVTLDSADLSRRRMREREKGS